MSQQTQSGLLSELWKKQVRDVYLTSIQWYLIAINVAAFLLNTLDYQIYKHRGSGIRPEVLINLSTIMGGALGAVIAEVIWDRKVNKGNALSRIYTLVWLIIQVSFCWVLFGPNRDVAKDRITAFYNSHRVFCWYCIAINIITFVMFVVDKIKALTERWRIREVLLLGLSLVGGAFGGLLAMDICNHKIKSAHFIVGLPLMICAHLVIICLSALGAI